MLQKRFHFKKWYLGQLSQGSSWAQRILDKKSAAIKYLKGALPIIGSPPVWDTGTVPDSYISGTRPGQGWEFNFSRHQTCQMMRLMLLRYWRAIQNQVNLTARTVLHLVTPPKWMNLRRSSKGGEGHFQSTNICCRFFTFQQDSLSIKFEEKNA